jgi:hypothetical protein
MSLTANQKSALKWLINHTGDGLFDKNGVLTAAGERAGVMRSTWNALIKAGLAEKYNKKRLRVTEQGRSVDLHGVDESKSVELAERT